MDHIKRKIFGRYDYCTGDFTFDRSIVLRCNCYIPEMAMKAMYRVDTAARPPHYHTSAPKIASTCIYVAPRATRLHPWRDCSVHENERCHWRLYMNPAHILEIVECQLCSNIELQTQHSDVALVFRMWLRRNKHFVRCKFKIQCYNIDNLRPLIPAIFQTLSASVFFAYEDAQASTMPRPSGIKAKNCVVLSHHLSFSAS